MRALRVIIWPVALMFVLASCGDASTLNDAGQPEQTPASDDVTSLQQQLGAIEAAVVAWRSAPSIEAAQVAAETAANLVVGPRGPGYGDRNGDGVVSGDTDVGVLPGWDGTPVGLASDLVSNQCVGRDVLGGTWADPGLKWDAMLNAIADWRPDNNTMPSLASHPQRIVGWATFTLESESLDQAHEYGGHASLHVDISLRALDC